MVSVRRNEGHLRAYIAGGGLVLGTALLAVFLAQSSPTFGDCIHDRKHARDYQAIKDHKPAFLVRSYGRLRLHIGCAGHSFDASSGGVTALFTIVLAITGIAQWSAIRRQANIAESQRQADEHARAGDIARLESSLHIAAAQTGHLKEQADALKASLASNRPWLFVYGLGRIQKGEDGDDGARFLIRYTIANYGRSPAIIRTTSRGFIKPGEDGPPWNIINQYFDAMGEHVVASGEVKRGEFFVFLEDEMALTGQFAPEGGGEEFDFYLPASTSQTAFGIVIGYDGPTGGDYETRSIWLFDPSFGDPLRSDEDSYMT